MLTQKTRQIGYVVALLVPLLFSTSGRAKRLPPPEVAPIVDGDVTYSVPHMQYEAEEMEHNGGYVLATDASGSVRWLTEVYSVSYNGCMEQDAQENFIASLALENGQLVVIDESNRLFRLDAVTGDRIQ